MDDLAALADKLTFVASALSGAELTKVINRTALAAKNDALKQLDSDLHGRKFTNWKPKLSVGYEMTGDDSAVVKPRPNGPWKVLDQGRSPGSKTAKRGRYRGRLVGWGSTKGRHTWEHAAQTIQHETPGRIDEGVQGILRKAFG